MEEFEALSYMRNLHSKFDVKNCLNCNSINVIVDTNMGNMVCVDCGTEKTDAIISLSADIGINDENSNFSKASECVTGINAKVQSTKIKGGPAYLAYMHKWNNGYTYKNTIYNKVCGEMNNLIKTNKLGISQAILDHSQNLYRNYMETSKNIKRSKSNRGIIAGCLYWGCKKYDFSITNQRLADLYGIEINYLKDGISIIHENNKTNMFSKDSYMFNPTTVEHYITKYCNTFKLEDKYTIICTKMGKVIDDNIDYFDNTPATLACATIYHINHKYKIMPLNQMKDLINNNCQAKSTTAINCNKNVISKNLDLFKNILE